MRQHIIFCTKFLQGKYILSLFTFFWRDIFLSWGKYDLNSFGSEDNLKTHKSVKSFVVCFYVCFTFIFQIILSPFYLLLLLSLFYNLVFGGHLKKRLYLKTPISDLEPDRFNLITLFFLVI